MEDFGDLEVSRFVGHHPCTGEDGLMFVLPLRSKSIPEPDSRRLETP